MTTNNGSQARLRNRSRIVSNLALSLLTASGAAFGLAAEAKAQASEEEDIVVTATRREQLLQDVPIAVSAFGGEALEELNVTNTSDLQRIAPSLTMQSSNSETGGSTIRIRGVDTTGNNIGLEGAVGVFIDGVYRQRAGLALNNLFDVARVEVLRGPQGTLFGKNTSAGAISVVPNTPRLGEFQLMGEFGAGNYEDFELQGMVNLPLADSFALRAAGAVQWREGYMTDLRTDEQSYTRDRELYRVQGLWEINDSASWRVSLDYAAKDEHCCQATYRLIGGTALANAAISGVVLPSTFSFVSATTPGRETVEQTDDWGVSSHLTIDFDAFSLSTILAHRNFEAINTVDADFGPSDILFQSFPATQNLNSAEIQLQGDVGQLDWLLGAYYTDETIDQTVSTTYGIHTNTYVHILTGGGVNAALNLYPAGGGNVSNAFEQEGASWSIFTHNTYEFSDQFSATVGLRFNHEEKEGGGRNFIVNSPSCTAVNPVLNAVPALRTLCPRPDYRPSLEENEWTGTANLQWSPGDDVMLYASYSRGYKAGGINLDRDASVRPVVGPVLPTGALVPGATQAQIDAAALFLPEFSNSYEVGLRTQSFDRQLTLNLTGFLTDYEDFQLNTFTGLGFIISNPGNVESHGVELESRWAPSDHFYASLNAAWVVAEYGDDPALKADPNPADPFVQPLAGRQLTNAPEWSVSGAIHFEQPLTASVSAFADLSANYRSEYNTGSDLDPRKFQESFTLVNGRVGLFADADEGGWDAYVWGTNITDEDYHIITFNSVFQAGSLSTFPGAPSMYGFTLRKQFSD